jgi:hypothetical protein
MSASARRWKRECFSRPAPCAPLLPVVGRPLIPAGGARKRRGKPTNSCRGREKTAASFPSARRVRGTPLEIRLVLRDVAGGSHMGHLPFSKCGTGNTWTQP